MDIVLFVLRIRGLRPLLTFYFRVEQKFAGGKFREIPFTVDIYFAGGKFRAKSKFANIANISSTRKIRVIQYLQCLCSKATDTNDPTLGVNCNTMKGQL